VSKIFDYYDLTYELETVKMEVESMSDEALIEACLNTEIVYECEDLNELPFKFFCGHELTKEDRKKLEAAYILAYSDMFWED
jgi:hypothetical protein